ncbi:MAG: inositol monophosphatase family protein [Alphaproteobacteria bacterium]|nr:inositol monophosphatase family protein [Alphaproteobacteria bacterium]MBQ8677707.1 inositol monophosphatase family protein [Alphaproteobacteria bacterium]
MIEELLKFTKKSGILLKKQEQKTTLLGKKDNTVESVVTQADVAVSNLFEKFVKKTFSHLNYMIIDEEKMSKFGDKIFEYIKTTEYQFVIDPIDGTLQYANHHPFYGITIGVYHKARPLMGIIYLPRVQELVYCDERKAYYMHNAFARNQWKEEIKAGQITTSPIIFGHSWLWKQTKEFSIKKNVLIDYYSAVSQSLYTLTGQAKAYAMNLHLWDIAGAMPIAEKVGMKIFQYEGNVVYDHISDKFFDLNMWTRKPCILCNLRDLEEIRAIMAPKLK